jgi:hypothetical protein
MLGKNTNTKESLLGEILQVTKECLVYANEYDVDKLTVAINTREGYIRSLVELCKREKINNEEAKFFKTINEETALLMEKMQIRVAKLSDDLASLYDGKQVIKYI